MKKVCCSLLLLLFTFVCLFATIPKNISFASSITSNSDLITKCYPYFSPQSVEFRLTNDMSFNLTPSYYYPYYGSNNTLGSYNYVASYFQVGGDDSYYIEYNYSPRYNTTLVSEYWQSVSSSYSNDYSYENIVQIEAINPTSYNDNLVINYDIPIHSYDFLLAKSLYQIPLLQFDSSSFIGADIVVSYDLDITYPSRANASDTSAYETVNYTGSFMDSGANNYNIDITCWNRGEFYSLINTMPSVHERAFLVGGSITVTVLDWQIYADTSDISNIDFTYLTLTHDERSYFESQTASSVYGGGSYPLMNLINTYYNPNGLPSSGGSGSNDNFIPNLATSLLNGVNNFMSFELSPGFSLGSLLALIVAIPLLILILKLFLGG